MGLSKRISSAIAVVLTCLIWHCSSSDFPERKGETPLSQKTIEHILKENTDRLMAIEGVVGIAQSLCGGKDCLHVYVAQDSKKIRQQIPTNIQGYEVQIIVTGEIKALDK